MMHLRQLSDLCLRLIEGELVHPFLDYVSVPRSLKRSCGARRANPRWGWSFKIYDLCTEVLRSGTPRVLVPLSPRDKMTTCLYSWPASKCD